MVRQLVLLETVFVSITWYYTVTVYSFGVASIGLKLFSVVTETTLEKSQPDVPPSCVCVCVCFLPIHSGHQVRWTYQPGSHRRKVTQDF